MINIALQGIAQEKVYQSRHLTEGLNLIRSWTSGLVVPDGVAPIIAGGAVRDVFFKNRTPHDVDIFFAQGDTSNLPAFSREGAARQLLENLYMWLEDREIEWRSLTREQQEDYTASGQSYADIIEFRKDGILYQIMVPQSIPMMDTLLDRFPVMCKCALSLDKFHITLPGYVAMKHDIPVGYNSRDFSYLRKKYEGQEVLPFSDLNQMYYCLSHRLAVAQGLDMPTTTMTRELSYGQFATGNANATSVVRRLIRMEFGLDSSNTLENLDPQVPSHYSAGRVRNVTLSQTGQFVNATTSAANSFGSLRARFS